MSDANEQTQMEKTAAEIAEAQKKERRVIKEDAELLAGLMKHLGWPRYLALIEAVSQNYHRTVMTPLANSFEVTKTEFAKGALTGLSLAAALPSTKIREASELAKTPDAET